MKKVGLIIFMLLSFFKVLAQDDSDVFYTKALEEGKKKNYRKSANLCIQGLRLSPDNVDLTQLLGKSYLELGVLDSARYFVKKVHDKRKKSSAPLKYLVNIEMASKRYSSAICYVNELLEFAPYDKHWWSKKIAIYRKMGNTEEAVRSIKRLKIIFPKDTTVHKLYNSILLEKGNESIKLNNPEKAEKIYKNIITSGNADKETFLGLIKSELLLGNKEKALQIAERALFVFPNDSQLIRKKVGILEELGRYDVAIVYAKSKRNILKSTLPYLVGEASRFYKERDPYELMKEEYEITKGKTLAVKIINKAIANGYENDATYFIKKELKRAPNNLKVLKLKLRYFFKFRQEKEYNKLLLNLYKRFPEDEEIREIHSQFLYKRAKRLLIEKDYDKALDDFSYLSSQKDYEIIGLEGVFTIHNTRARYDNALVFLEKLLSLTKSDAELQAKYLFRKAVLYKDMKQFNEALKLTDTLIKSDSENEKYKNLRIAISEGYVVHLMKDEKYKKAYEFATASVQKYPSKSLRKHILNATIAMGDFEKAKAHGEIDLEINPEDKNLNLKLAGVYTESKDYDSAIKVLTSLLQKYPYSKKIKGSLAEVLFLKAKKLEKEGKQQSAIEYYSYSLEQKQTDNSALLSLVNLYIKTKQANKALQLVNRQLAIKPNHELYYKKGLVYESLKEYDSAYYYQQKYTPPLKEYDNWSKRIKLLKYNTFKNELDFNLDNKTSEDTGYSFFVASLQYSRYHKKNVYSGRVNYAARKQGGGVQLNLGWSHVFTPTIYTELNYSIANRFFPKHRLRVSVFKTFKNDYELELGTRYRMVSADKNILGLVLGGAKTINEFWLNAKVLMLRDQEGDFYSNVIGQARYYMQNKDYLSMIVSVGSAPYDENFGSQSNTLLSYANTLVGLGYSKQVTERAFFTINGNYGNYRINNDYFIRQLGIQLAFKVRF